MAALTRAQIARLRHAARSLAELYQLSELRRMLHEAEAAVDRGENFDDWLSRKLNDATRWSPAPAPAVAAGQRCAVLPGARPLITRFRGHRWM